MIEAQGNRCAICGHPPSGKGHCSRLHVDHDKAAGQIRGMLCANCNRGIGLLRDSVSVLAAATLYLTRFVHLGSHTPKLN